MLVERNYYLAQTMRTTRYDEEMKSVDYDQREIEYFAHILER